MLSFFPTPYPDELWYSVLCRYHTRSGNSDHSATVKELFNGKVDMALSSFSLTSAIYEVIEQLPADFLDFENIALEHTLFKYSFRLYPVEKKYEILRLIKEGSFFPSGKLSEPDQIFKRIKACPICMEEDLKKYGETYWHLAHQIPLMNICHKHKCSLWVHECISKKYLDQTFILPETCESFSKDYVIKEYDDFLSKTLMQYLYLPLEVGPPNDYNNIYEELINRGYGTVRRDREFLMNLRKISEDLCGFYGEDFIRKYFINKNLHRLISNSVRTWHLKSPERYVLLATFLQQPAEITFCSEKIENEIYKKFLEFSKSPLSQTKEFIAKELGVKPETVNIIAHNLDTGFFWKNSAEEKKIRKERIVVSLTQEEKNKIMKYVRDNGFCNTSTFIINCIEEKINENKTHTFSN